LMERGRERYGRDGKEKEQPNISHDLICSSYQCRQSRPELSRTKSKEVEQVKGRMCYMSSYQ
jgi:hypothetical protein